MAQFAVNLVAMFVWAAFRLSGVHCSVIKKKTQYVVVDRFDISRETGVDC
jgi:hypothetical protein